MGKSSMKETMMSRRIIMIVAVMSVAGLSWPVFIFQLPWPLQASSTTRVWEVPADFQTIQEAVNNAGDGDTILIAPGVYTENITIAAKSLSLVGVDKETTVIDGNSSAQVLIISDGAAVAIYDLKLQNGRGTYGGGIRAEDSQLTIHNTILINNVTIDSGSSLGAGAGIFAVDTDLTILRSHLVANASSGGGGGIYYHANLQPTSLVIYDTQVLSNSTNVNGGGIAIFTSSAAPPPLISHSTIAYNSALAGGGISVNGSETSAPLNLINSTVSANVASSYGGGVLVYTQVNLEHATILGNQPSGIYLAGANLVTARSIIANSIGGSNCIGTSHSVNSIGYSISSDFSCELNQSTDLSGVDPLLGPLQSNRGPTPTHAPLLDSPVLQAASSCLTDDQRGRPRMSVLCDIGAYEAKPYAVDDQLFTFPNSSTIIVDVLANDFAGVAGALMLESISSPANGSASIIDHQIFYTPTSGFLGTEVLSYAISDEVITATANLTITINAYVYLPIIMRP
jgi:hypothetical protein